MEHLQDLEKSGLQAAIEIPRLKERGSVLYLRAREFS